MLDSRVIDLLDSLSASHSAQSELVESIKAHYRGKMWHQITDELVKLSADSAFDQGSDLIQLFDGFIKDTAGYIN